MTPQQATAIGKKVAAICPAQKFNEETPEAWAALLADVDYEDALGALIALGKTHRFIAPADIISEVSRVRADRLCTHVIPPPAEPDNPIQYREQVRASVAAAAEPGPGRVPALEPGSTTPRGRQFIEHGQHWRPPTHRPEIDHRSQEVRQALAQVRQACTEASARRRASAKQSVEESSVSPTPLEGDPTRVTVEDCTVAIAHSEESSTRTGAVVAS